MFCMFQIIQRCIYSWMGIPDSIRVRFERPCPEDDVQCGQHGSSGFLWASVCLHCGGKVHQWCYLRVRVLGWLVVEFRVEQSQQQNPRYWNIANIAQQKHTKDKEHKNQRSTQIRALPRRLFTFLSAGTVTVHTRNLWSTTRGRGPHGSAWVPVILGTWLEEWTEQHVSFTSKEYQLRRRSHK